jgi:ligand-binding sensor domain-containing protein
MIYDRKRNCLWINSHDGLTQFTLTDEQFHHIDALNFLVSRKDYDRYVGIDMDPQGRIWFATIPKGIIIYDPATQTITDPIEDSTVQTEVADGNLKIYCDKEASVWASYWECKRHLSVNPVFKGGFIAIPRIILRRIL